MKRFIPSVMTGLMLAILLALGTWQMERKIWKEDLIARVEERMGQPPAPCPSPKTWSNLTPEQDEYRKVKLTGQFRHADTLYLYGFVSPETAGPGRVSGQGYFVITPMETSKGLVLVNRGFVPMDKRDPASRPGSEPDGNMTITGIMRFSEPRGAMAPADAPQKREFYTRDIALFTQTLGLDKAKTAPFLIDSDDMHLAGGLPQGGNTRVSFPNRHLEYALTWYGLAVALLVIFVIYRRREKAKAAA